VGIRLQGQGLGL